MNDKTNKITLHNPYLRDTGKLMRVPILNNDTTSSCFGGSLKRYVEKMNQAQRYLHCRAILDDKRPNQVKKGNKGFYYDSCHLGQNKIASLFQKGAKLLGMSTKQFCPHSLRSLFITNMVNDERVSNEESMKAARHSSVDAHLGYQELGKVSEGNRIQCLLDARPDKEKGPTTKTLSPESPHFVQLQTPASNCSSSSSFSHPGFATQVEWASFCAEKKAFETSLGLANGSPPKNEILDMVTVKRAKMELEGFDDLLKKKKRKKRGKFREQIQKLRDELDIKKEQFESANSMFDRVIEKERLYRRELDTHYDRDVDDLKRDIGCLVDVQKSNEREIAALEEENQRMKADNERLLEIVYGNGRNVLRDSSNIRPVQPRMIPTRAPRNPDEKQLKKPLPAYHPGW